MVLSSFKGPFWRRQWHPTPVLWPGKSHGRRSLVGCSPWGHKESDTTEWLHFHALEKEMAAHSSVLAWRIPGTGEPGGLPSMGSHRVGHDWSDLVAVAAAAAAAKGHSVSPSLFKWAYSLSWRRNWQPSPVFFPRESHGQRSLVGCSPWGCKELDTTEWLTHIP